MADEKISAKKAGDLADKLGKLFDKEVDIDSVTRKGKYDLTIDVGSPRAANLVVEKIVFILQGKILKRFER